MSAIAVSAVISAVSLLLSIAASSFISGSRWGTARAELDSLKAAQVNQATKADVQDVAQRLARIEGMFELRLRDDRAA